MSLYGVQPKRCPETRAHYSHPWYNPLRLDCPGGPAEPDLEVEIDEVLDQPTTCRVRRNGVLVFDGVSRDAQLTALEEQ